MTTLTVMLVILSYIVVYAFGACTWPWIRVQLAKDMNAEIEKMKAQLESWKR